VRLLLEEFAIEDLAAAHLNHAFAPSDAMRLVKERLEALR
jgi:hypothetical protein